MLVTRALGQASALAEALRSEGAEVLLVPAIELAPPASCCGLDAAITTLRAYEWVVFTSANGVHAFAARARRLGLPAAARRVAVIGPSTGRAVLAEGIAAEVEVQPERFVAEALVDTLRERVRGSAVLLVRAAEGRELLVDGLVEAGAEVTIAEAYRTVVPADSVAALQEVFAGGAVPDVATFTSGSSVLNLDGLLRAAGLRLPDGIVLASIGPITSQAMRELGWEVSVEASEASIGSLVSGLVSYFGSK